MERVIVAFEGEQNRHRIRDVIESDGLARCVLCRSGAEVKRVAIKEHIDIVICGFKLPDLSAEDLFGDLPAGCSMLLVAAQGRLDLCGNSDIFRLTAPASRGDLLGSVRMLIQLHQGPGWYRAPRRSREEEDFVRSAKALLMERNGMTEDQAHRFLQKQSMDRGMKLAELAQTVLASG